MSNFGPKQALNSLPVTTRPSRTNGPTWLAPIFFFSHVRAMQVGLLLSWADTHKHPGQLSPSRGPVLHGHPPPMQMTSCTCYSRNHAATPSHHVRSTSSPLARLRHPASMENKATGHVLSCQAITSLAFSSAAQRAPSLRQRTCPLVVHQFQPHPTSRPVSSAPG